MADIIKRHNFDQALRKINQFSNNVPSIPYIPKFEIDGGMFGWGKHYINGKEMNSYVEKIQDIFRKQNDIIVSTIREFREIYNTFDYLDREYIQGILGTANAAREASNQANTASNQAKTASEQAKDAANRALKNEADIRKEVEALSKIVLKLKNIKEEFNSKIHTLEQSFSLLCENIKVDIAHQIPSKEEISELRKDIAVIRNGNYLCQLNILCDEVISAGNQVEELETELLKLDERLSNSLNAEHEAFSANISSVRKECREIKDSISSLDKFFNTELKKSKEGLDKQLDDAFNLVFSEIKENKQILAETNSKLEEKLINELGRNEDQILKIRSLSEVKWAENKRAIADVQSSISEKIQAESAERAGLISEVRTFTEARCAENKQAIVDVESSMSEKIQAESANLAGQISEVLTFTETKCSENRQTITDVESSLSEKIEAESAELINQISEVRTLTEAKCAENRQAIADVESNMSKKIQTESAERIDQITEVRIFAEAKCAENKQAIADVESNMSEKMQAESSERISQIADVINVVETKSSDNLQAIEITKKELQIKLNEVSDALETLSTSNQIALRKLRIQVVISYIVGGLGLIIGALAYIL